MAVAPAFSQEERARSLTLDFGQGLEASTNPDLIEDPERDEVILRSDVDLRYVTGTRAQSLQFGIGVGLEGGAFADGDSGGRVAERRVDFGYNRESASGTLNVVTEYSRSRVEEDDIPDDFETEDLEVTDGERGQANLRLSLETGRDRLVGTEVEADYSSVRYYDNDGDGRDDLDLQAALRLGITSRTDLLLLSGLSSEDHKGEDQYETETVSLGVGFRHELTSRQRLSGELRDMRRESSEILDNGILEEEEQNGLGGGLGYEADIGRGTLALRFDSALHSIGRRDMVEISHTTTSDAGSFFASLGVVDSELLEQEPLVNLTWQRNLSRGVLQVQLQQEAGGTEDSDQESIRSRLGAGYLGQLTRVSSWETELSLVESNEFGEDTNDGRRGEVMIGYRHGLAKDWDLAVRYRHVLSESDDREDRTDNSVFLGLATRVQLK